MVRLVHGVFKVGCSWQHFIHQTKFLGFGSRNAFAEQQHFAGALVANDLWQQQAGAGFRAQAQIGKRQLQEGFFSGVHQVTMEQHGGANTNGHAAHGCNHRFARKGDRLHKLHRWPLGPCIGRSDKIVHIIATGKTALRPPDQDNAHITMLIGHFYAVSKCGIHGLGEGVFFVRPVDLQHKNTVVKLVCNIEIGRSDHGIDS